MYFCGEDCPGKQDLRLTGALPDAPQCFRAVSNTRFQLADSVACYLVLNNFVCAGTLTGRPLSRDQTRDTDYCHCLFGNRSEPRTLVECGWWGLVHACINKRAEHKGKLSHKKWTKRSGRNPCVSGSSGPPTSSPRNSTRYLSCHGSNMAQIHLRSLVRIPASTVDTSQI